MTDRPYTDDDLRAEAARQHFAATEDPDFVGIGEQMDDEMWRSLSEDDFDAAQTAIDDLLTSAVDVSRWAINLGVAGLTPHQSMGWFCVTSGWDCAIQVATSPDLTDDARTELLAAIKDAVDATVKRVLGHTAA